jgi:hypothetical protein
LSTKDELITAVMLDVGDRPTDSAIRTLYETWFDDALDMVFARWPWNHRRGVGEIEIVALDFTSHALDAEISEIKALRIQGASPPLLYVERDKLLTWEADLTQTGTPTHWYYMGWDTDQNAQLLGLWPIPEADLTLEYDGILEVPLPLDGADEIPMPRGGYGILREFIRGYSYENEALDGLAHAAWSRGVARLERLANTKGISRPEKRSRLREDGDLAHVRRRYPESQFAAIPSTS